MLKQDQFNLMQRHDMTLNRHCFNIVCLLGKVACKLVSFDILTQEQYSPVSVHYQCNKSVILHSIR